MAEYHPRMRDWLEKRGTFGCNLPDCEWKFTTSGIDTKGDLHDAFTRHLARHDAELSAQLDAWAASA